MSVTGPVTRDTSTLALGLAQVRIGASSSNMGNIHAVLTASDSIGSLANTKFTHTIEHWKHESGFPGLEDYTIALRGSAMMECAPEEMTPYNLALALGIDPTGGGYSEAHSGVVALGNLQAPDYVRMEARYTFPNGSNYMDIIFPRAQVSSSPEIDLQKEEAANLPITIESKIASSDVSGGSAVWDNMPLGIIEFT